MRVEINDYYNYRCGDAYLKSIAAFQDGSLYITGDGHDAASAMSSLGIENKLSPGISTDGHDLQIPAKDAGKALGAFLYFGFQNITDGETRIRDFARQANITIPPREEIAQIQEDIRKAEIAASRARANQQTP